MLQESKAKIFNFTTGIFDRPECEWDAYISQEQSKFPSILNSSAKELGKYVANYYACLFCAKGKSFLEIEQVQQIADSLQSPKKVDIYNAIVSQEHNYRLLLSSMVNKYQTFKAEIDILNVLIQLIISSQKNGLEGTQISMLNSSQARKFLESGHEKIRKIMVDLKTKGKACVDYYCENNIEIALYKEMLHELDYNMSKPIFFLKII